MEQGRVERRLAAILSADVAGYSRLIGIDEEGTLARLKVVRGDLVDSMSLPLPNCENSGRRTASI